MADDHSPRRLAAILAADVVGYSRLVGIDEEGTLAPCATIVRPWTS
jgi:adenylate cyclase